MRRALRSADRFTDEAIARGLCRKNTPFSRSIASLVAITLGTDEPGAEEAGARSSREAITIPTATDAIDSRMA